MNRGTSTLLVCETTGRWAAALRTAISRRSESIAASATPWRVLEVRTFAEFDTALLKQQPTLGLVEVGRENLPTILANVTRSWHRKVQLVALIDKDQADQPRSAIRNRADLRAMASVLLEAGALDTIDSPRQINRVLEIASRVAKSQQNLATADASLDSIADRAWAALPWQGA